MLLTAGRRIKTVHLCMTAWYRESKANEHFRNDEYDVILVQNL